MNHNLMEARERLITAKEEYNQVMMLDWLQVTLAKYAKATDDGQKADALENAWHSLQGLKGNFETLRREGEQASFYDASVCRVSVFLPNGYRYIGERTNSCASFSQRTERNNSLTSIRE